VPDNPDSERQNVPKCERCGETTELVTAIQRLGDTPAYRLFECHACQFITWIAEEIT